MPTFDLIVDVTERRHIRLEAADPAAAEAVARAGSYPAELVRYRETEARVVYAVETP